MINNNKNNHFGLIAIGILLPLAFYYFLPMLGVDIFASMFALDNIFKLLILAIGLGLYFYTFYLGTSKFVIIPILTLFFYQMAYRFLIYYSPVVINLRSLILLIVAPIGLFFLNKYGFKKNLIPFLGVLGFYLINLAYTFLNYAYSPNHLYNLNLYLHRKYSILPNLYSIDLLILLTFLIAGIYFTLNIFKNENKQANSQFSKILIGFIIINSFICFTGFAIGNNDLTNVVAGVQRLQGFFTHPNVFAFFNVCSAIFLSIKVSQNKNKKLKYASIFAILLTVISTLLSFSRVNSLGVIAILTLNYIIFSKEKFKAIIKIVNFGILALLIFVATDFTLNWNLSEMIFARINDVSSNDFRPMVLKYLASQVDFNGPLFYGNGIAACSNTLFRLFSDRYFVNTPIVYHPHNTFVHIFYDYGIIGFMLYFSTLFSLLKTGFSNIFIENQINPSALVLTEMLTFALLASFVDCYTFNLEMIPFWILACILYVNTLETTKKLSSTTTDGYN